ncbi:hypothetical protein FRC17_002738 [Serendipita sp. 399]|nr:hypothetical protein FRC17_002738 [Serendipita sp. 399]
MAFLTHSPDLTQPQPPFPPVARTRTRTRDMYTRSSPEDVRIRSSDNITFYIHKPLLVYASPIFKDMFDLCASHPQPSSPSPPSRRSPPLLTATGAADDGDDLLLFVDDATSTEEAAQSSHQHHSPSSAADITLSEPASTLSLLFAHLDPTIDMTRDSRTMTIDDVWLCMSAAVKYQMDGVLVRLRSVLTSPSSSSSPPVATPPLFLHNSQQRQPIPISSADPVDGDGGLVVLDPLPASVLAYQFGFLPELRMALRELAKCHIRHLMLSSSAAAPHTDTPGGSAGGGGTTMMWQVGVPLILLRYIPQLRRARARWFISKARLLYHLPTMDDYPTSTHPSTSASDTRFTSPSSSWWFWGSKNTENDDGDGYHRSKGGNEQANRNRKQGGKGGRRGSECTQCMRYRALHLHEVCNVLVDHPSWDVFRHQLFHSGSYSPFNTTYHQHQSEDEDDTAYENENWSESGLGGHGGRVGAGTTMVHCVCGASTIPLDAHPRLVLDWTQWERDAKRLEQELPIWPPPSLATTTTTTTTAAGF